MRNLLIACLFLNIITVKAQQLNVYFLSGSDSLDQKTKADLDQFAMAHDNPLGKFKLVGYADVQGDSIYNLALSKRRVEAVKAYLISQFVYPDQIQTSFLGEQKSKHAKMTFDRRVEVTFEDKNLAEVFSEFQSTIKPQKQEFMISLQENVVLEGEKGTIIHIKKNTLTHANGDSVRGEVKVELTEFYSVLDFYSTNLTTVSNGEVIESGGMVLLKATAAGQPLKIREGEYLDIDFPEVTASGYQTFYGDSLADGSMNWIPEQQKVVDKSIEDKPLNTASDLVMVNWKYKKGENEYLLYDRVTKEYMADSTSIATYMKKQKEAVENPQQTIPMKVKVIEKSSGYQKEPLYIKLRSFRLGFINCDRFLRPQPANPNRQDRTVPVDLDLMVYNEQFEIISVNVLVTKRKIMLSLKFDKDAYKLQTRLPREAFIKVVILAKDKEQNEFLRYIETMPVERKIERLVEFTSTTLEEFASGF